MAAILTFAPFILQLALWVLETFFLNDKQDKESRALFLELAQKLRDKGIKGVRSRFEAEAQIDEGNTEWNRREKETPPPES